MVRPLSLALSVLLVQACGGEPGDTTAAESTGAASTGAASSGSGTGSAGATTELPTTGAEGSTSGAAATSDGSEASSGEASTGAATPRRFLAVDNGKNQLLLVDPGGGGWSVPIPGGARDLQLVDDDQVLLSHGAGALELALADGSEGWSVGGFSGVQTARRLPGGNTLLGMQGNGEVKFTEVDPGGALVQTLTVPGMLELRLVRVLDDGHLLFTAILPNRVVEVDMTGAVVWEAPLPDKGYTAERLPGGDTLATAGEPCLVVRLSPAGDVVEQLGGEAMFPRVGLDWFSGFDLLADGNIVVANWLGHDAWGTGPHLVELTPDNQLVWQWEDFEAAMQITNVLVFDE
ncbi:MAG: hypothetical protein IPO88_27145 [Nannocystis sp.]|uniref:hypothetical protein n=1 Tax=Nannocystis sp. TaxID=1962667 RepID=UPI002428E673|nr:hypothetical protein [Nannocystis sp.]MBK9757107.1 hypothetical protein [Nannocystis sp.]